jgi:hypothetical protein
MKSPTAILAVALLASSVAVAQQEDICKKEVLGPQDTARTYLSGYYVKCITKETLEKQTTEWGVTPSDFGSTVPGWLQLASTFTRLANASSGGEMAKIYIEMADRSRESARTLKAGLQARRLSDKALYRADAWDNVKMNLNAYNPAPPTDPNDLSFPDRDVGSALDADCKDKASTLCRATLANGKQGMMAWRLAEQLAGVLSGATVEMITKQVALKDKLWNVFLYDSKPMLFFDFAITDLLEKQWSKSDQYPQGFREPPTRQWFVLHPSLGVEYASAASDGQQMKPVLYLEAIGVNYWNKETRPWKAIPLVREFSGVSLIVAYADRAGIKDTGIGALLTFDNVYTLGITRYGSDTGISVSLELASLYREKLKPDYDLWRNRISK